MDVQYHHSWKCGPNLVMANIKWHGKWPMAKGQFPPEHPCVLNAAGLQAFREKGYWASPFPEGDGITMDSKGRSADQVVADIRECLGWTVTSKSEHEDVE